MRVRDCEKGWGELQDTNNARPEDLHPALSYRNTLHLNIKTKECTHRAAHALLQQTCRDISKADTEVSKLAWLNQPKVK